MSVKAVFDFLRSTAGKPEIRARLRSLPKAEVLVHARKSGFDFTDAEFDDGVWGVEMFLAERIGETFDLSFSLWETMWGKHYLDYLLDDVSDCLSEGMIADFLARRPS
jgi:Nif11 domain